MDCRRFILFYRRNSESPSVVYIYRDDRCVASRVSRSPLTSPVRRGRDGHSSRSPSLHLVATRGDADFAMRWRLIKTWFAKHSDPALRKVSEIGSSANRRLKHQPHRPLWQHRYWEHVLRDEDDYAGHMDYIHFNPVKHGLVSLVKEWPHSSFNRSVELGIYPMDWGHDDMNLDDVGSE